MIYVIQTRPNEESILKKRLLYMGIKAYVPEEQFQIRRHGKWHMQSRYIFSGYVFIDAEYDAELHQKIRRLDGFLHFLGEPTPLSETESKQIKWLCNGGKPIWVSHYIKGRNGIVFVDGILAERNIKLVKAYPRQKRAKAVVSINGKEIKVFLPIERHIE